MFTRERSGLFNSNLLTSNTRGSAEITEFVFPQSFRFLNNMELFEDPVLKTQYKKNKFRLKQWESSFMEKYGRKPNKVSS